MRALVLAKAKLGDGTGAAQWAAKMTAEEGAGTEERVHAAWLAMAQGKADTEALNKLKTAKTGAELNKDYAYALAMMQTALDMADDALAGLTLSTNRLGFADLPAAAWAIHGKTCDRYGFAASAKTAVERARKAAAGESGDLPVWLLALLDR